MHEKPGIYPKTVEIDGTLWWVCPARGPNCCRVSNDLGGTWAEDAIDVHVQVSHGRLVAQAATLRAMFDALSRTDNGEPVGGDQ